MKIGIDMGHSLSGAGTGAVGIKKEVDMNRLAGKRLIAMLQEKGHTVVNCTTDYASSTDAQLTGIVSKEKAQKLDCFVSLHLNSFNSSAHGVETYIYNGNWSTKNEARAFAKRINDELANRIGWYNRGVKEANYKVLRETNSMAVLVELGFCSNADDMAKWDTEKIAKALFKGITGSEYVAPQPVQSSNTFYRVVCGSFKTKALAETRVTEVKNRTGHDSFLVAYDNNGATYYRVICGSFNSKESAQARANEVKAKSGFDCFLAVYNK